MNKLTPFTLLFTSLLAVACGGSPDQEPTPRSNDEALMNNGGGPSGTSSTDLEGDGYACGPVGGLGTINPITVCTKTGGPTYYCDRYGNNCHTAKLDPLPPHLPPGATDGVNAKF